MIIRQYEESDRQNVRQICLVTANAENADDKKKKLILNLYCDYYITYEPQNCFVLTDDENNAVGYILCSENYDRYIKIFKNNYLYKIRSLGTSAVFISLGELFVHRIPRKKHPAHMHIDILPEYQRIGAGTKLLQQLKDNLKSKNIHSIVLCVGADNEKGVNFYRKNGFKILKNLIFCYLMVLEF